ncbi:MAG TPA: hypothetical protein PLF42_03210 [Anaerolineales bacterium]|nr:hypothetical protein [Anaerolineales bacterium]
MTRKILTGTLIVVSSILLLLSAAGIVLAWVYNEPLTRDVVGRLEAVDAELELAETTLKKTKQEIERTLRIVNATEEALKNFTSNDPQKFFKNVQSTLDEGLVPELETARERLIAARDSLERLRVTLFGLNLVPFLQINIPDKILTDLIDSADAMQSQVDDVSLLARQASTFLDDASYLLGGDFTETKASLEFFLAAIDEYEQKISTWRGDIATWIERFPIWADRASIILTVFLLWFGLSQFGLILHGLSLRRGDDPLDALREALAKFRGR